MNKEVTEELKKLPKDESKMSWLSMVIILAFMVTGCFLEMENKGIETGIALGSAMVILMLEEIRMAIHKAKSIVIVKVDSQPGQEVRIN
jgi:hypothetical protein